MKFKEALIWGAQALAGLDKTLEQSAVESRILLKHATKLSHEEIILNREIFLDVLMQKKFQLFIKKRKQGIPIAYIISYKEFYGRDFLVSKKVLIPRPETETLVEKAILAINEYKNEKQIRILDLGTGSGAIAITIALESGNKVLVDALDNSSSALRVARQNAEKHFCQNVNFIKSNWYQSLINNQYHLILSNPPYIPSTDILLMAQETLGYEPKGALFAKDAGLKCFDKILSKAHKFLTPNGQIFLEIGYNQASSVQDIAQKSGFILTGKWQDLQGHDRVLRFLSEK